MEQITLQNISHCVDGKISNIKFKLEFLTKTTFPPLVKVEYHKIYLPSSRKFKTVVNMTVVPLEYLYDKYLLSNNTF